MANRKLKMKAPRKSPSLRALVYTVQARILADIKIIRLRWAEGNTDADIRQELNLNWREWKRRIRIMRSIPADDDVIKSFRRYAYEHDKAVAKMHERLKGLSTIHGKAMEDVSIFGGKVKGKKPKLLFRKPRDLHLAASVVKSMQDVDRDILKAESDFVAVKQRLGMIEIPVPEGYDPFGDSGMSTITAPNLMKAWQLRKEREELKRVVAAEDITEEAVIVGGNGRRGNGAKKAKTKK
jgi:hypothetical protein